MQLRVSDFYKKNALAANLYGGCFSCQWPLIVDEKKRIFPFSIVTHVQYTMTKAASKANNNKEGIFCKDRLLSLLLLCLAFSPLYICVKLPVGFFPIKLLLEAASGSDEKDKMGECMRLVGRK